jgi:iron complex transport system ATP-binding protein
MAVISARGLTVGRRLRQASFELERGELLGLLGPNGAGKSTLLNALAGVVPFQGEVAIGGQSFAALSPRRRAQLVALQPQAVTSAWSIAVRDVVALGRLPWGDEHAAAVTQAMRRANVEQFAQRKVDQLSGGERARVWLARVLAGEPQVLLADEPSANLDIHYQLAVMEVLRDYARAGHAVMVALHDLSLAARYCDRLCLLDAGGIVALGRPAEVLTEALLSQVYGVAVEVDLARQPPIVVAR